MRLRDIGRVDDDLLLVMPLAVRSLSDAIKVGALNAVARLEALRQIAQGLVELAEVSVLHRDLKPANVLDVGGRWQLADFGLSRDLLESTGTYTFRGFGTLPYMAPELWNGQPATVKSDLYAYGVLAYEVLTGTRPFRGADEATLMRQHQQEAPPPLPDTTSPAIGRLVLRLLTKDPTARPQDARAVVEALDAASRRLAPKQERLQEAAFKAQQRHSGGDAARAAQATAQATEREQTTQALADLHHILEEAADLAREALPEVEFSNRNLDWHLAWNGVRVAVEVWTEARPLSPEDPLFLAGAIYAAPAGQAPSANIVCEFREGRLVWSLLRFTASAPSRYEYGPGDRPHGFIWPTFARQRVHMVHPAMHVWQLQQTRLTPETIVELLHEAISSG